MNVTIFANGEIASVETPLPSAGMIIAADGGGRHCLQMGIDPQVVIGDFDSLTETELSTLESRGATLIRHPADKDETDLELAINYALSQGATQITLYGLLGGRWDMSFANILLLGSPQYESIQFRIIAGTTELFIIRGGETLQVRGKPGAVVSAIPLNEDVYGLTYQGLSWPLEKAHLPFGTPRGVSNTLLGETAQISLETGILLVVVENQANPGNQ